MNMNVQRPKGVEFEAPDFARDDVKFTSEPRASTRSWIKYPVLLGIAGSVGYFVTHASPTALIVTGGVLVSTLGFLGWVVAQGVNDASFSQLKHIQTSRDWLSSDDP